MKVSYGVSCDRILQMLKFYGVQKATTKIYSVRTKKFKYIILS